MKRKPQARTQRANRTKVSNEQRGIWADDAGHNHETGVQSRSQSSESTSLPAVQPAIMLQPAKPEAEVTSSWIVRFLLKRGLSLKSLA
jgi:hypothetical protein